MMRTLLILFFACISTFATFNSSLAGNLPKEMPNTNKPNIVIMLSDDLGFRDLGCYNGPVKTPNLDALAAKGTRFTNFYAGCAVCSPSRATLLTGRHHIRAGIYSWIHRSHKSHLLESEITIAEMLKDQGYSNAHIGKWHLGMPPTPDKHGFDYWMATENNASPNHHNPRNFIRNGKPVGKIKGYSCQIVVDEAINWLDNRHEKQSPFFLNLSFHEPHPSRAAPKKITNLYRGDTKAKVYSGTIDNTDRAIGKLLEKLEQINQIENTIIIYASDNGTGRKDRTGNLRGKKGRLWEGGIRVPGIFYWPGRIHEGRTSDIPAGVIDILPTLCDIVGISLPKNKHIDGSSLKDILIGDGSNFNRHQPLYWHLQKSRPIVSIRDGKYSLVADPKYKIPTNNRFDEKWIPIIKKGEYKNFRMYNLVTDPGQNNDISKENPEIFEALKNKLHEINNSVMSEGSDWHLR